MKTFYSAQEIEDLARQGVRELVVDDNVVLTDLARQTAGQLGLRLVTGGSAAPQGAPGPAAAVTPAPAPRQAPASASAVAAASAAAPLPARPKGCQHGPLGERQAPATMPAPAPATAQGNGTFGGKVVEDLVGLVKQMSKR